MPTRPTLPEIDHRDLLDSHLHEWNDELKQELRQRGIPRQALADFLHITYGTLCKRLRGEAPWPLEHYLLLQRHFCLPDVRDCGPGTSLRYERVDPGSPFDPDRYLAQLEALAQLADVPGARLRVLSGELPVFYALAEPALAALKFYFFAHARRGTSSRLFCAADLPAELITRAGALARRYASLTPRDEVWGPHPLEGLIGQVRTLASLGLVAPAERAGIDAGLRAVVARLDDAITAGIAHESDGPPAGFRLREQPFPAVAPMFALDTPGAVEVFVTLDQPGHLRATSAAARSLFDESFARATAGARALSARVGRWQPYRDARLRSIDGLSRP